MPEKEVLPESYFKTKVSNIKERGQLSSKEKKSIFKFP